MSVVVRITKRLLTALALLVMLGLLSLSAVFHLHSDAIVGGSNFDHEHDRQSRPAFQSVPGSLPDGPPATSGPTIALTFDDGPDPNHTEDVLDALARHGVKGTFFVVGERVPENQDILRRIVDEGHEVGLHSYNHSKLGDLDDRQVLRQYRLTQMVVTGVTGQRALTARPPFSFTSASLSHDELHAAETAQAAGHRMVFAHRSPPDFSGISAAEIAELAMPEDGESVIITLHDGAGPLPRQVAPSLDILIPELQAQGYTFATLSEYAGEPTMVAAPRAEVWQAKAMVATIALYSRLEGLYRIFAIVFAPLLAARFLGILVSAWLQERRNRRAEAAGANRSGSTDEPGDPDEDGDELPGVSIIVPAYNEEVGILDALRSFQELDYAGPLEVVVVDDGSTDRTAELARQVDGVRVLSKENGGKASALNAGVARAKHEICVLVDGDTVIDQDALNHIVAPFADPKVGAVSGNLKVGNRVNTLTAVQAVEYIVGCALMRRAMHRLGMISCVPGALGAYRKQMLVELGGVPTNTLAEDTDLTVAIGSAGWKLAYAPRAIARTEAPRDIKALWKQRIRWSYGVMQVIWKHSRRPGRWNRYRASVLTFNAVDYVLAVATPVTDLLAILSLFSGPDPVLLGLVGATFLAQSLVLAYAIRLDGERPQHLLYVPLQLLFFRYFTAFIVVSSLAAAVSGRRERWNKPKRHGMQPDLERLEILTDSSSLDAEPVEATAETSETQTAETETSETETSETETSETETSETETSETETSETETATAETSEDTGDAGKAVDPTAEVIGEKVGACA